MNVIPFGYPSLNYTMRIFLIYLSNRKIWRRERIFVWCKTIIRRLSKTLSKFLFLISKKRKTSFDLALLIDQHRKQISTRLHHVRTRSSASLSSQSMNLTRNQPWVTCVCWKSPFAFWYLRFRLDVCDLAGNEPSTSGIGKQLTETCNINTSLMTFKDCIRVLNENQTSK